MATYDTTIHPLAFAHMEGGMKTVYVVPNSGQFAEVTSGDRIEFDDIGYITVGTIRRYDTLAELVEAEGYANIIPEAEDTESAMEAIRTSTDYSRSEVERSGILAIRIRDAKRKT